MTLLTRLTAEFWQAFALDVVVLDLAFRFLDSETQSDMAETSRSEELEAVERAAEVAAVAERSSVVALERERLVNSTY